jgi:hypothetical protein
MSKNLMVRHDSKTDKMADEIDLHTAVRTLMKLEIDYMLKYKNQYGTIIDSPLLQELSIEEKRLVTLLNYNED